MESFFDNSKRNPIKKNINNSKTENKAESIESKPKLREVKNKRSYPIPKHGVTKRIPIEKEDWFSLKQLEIFISENRSDLEEPRADLPRVTAGSIVEIIVSEFMQKLEQIEGNNWPDSFPNIYSEEGMRNWVKKVLN